MAWVQKRTKKDGTTSYRIFSSSGYDSEGCQIRHVFTWHPEPGMTPRQIEKALARTVADAEREYEQGYQTNRKITLSEYMRYVIDTKEANGLKARTIYRYRQCMDRIDQALGHMKIIDIRPQHINTFYKNLSESGIRETGEKCICKIDLTAWLKANKMSQQEMARRAGIGSATISAACKKSAVSKKTAEKISAVVGLPVNKVFIVSADTTPLSGETVLKYHRLLYLVLAQAERELLIPYNPAAKVMTPKTKKCRPDYYQPEEMDRILDALEGAPLKWRTLTYILMDSGCRRAEAAGLKWENVDLETGIIDIQRDLLYLPTKGVYEDTVKTESAARTVKLAPETVSLLKLWKAEQSEIRIAMMDRWTETGYVFTRDDGRPINPDSITSWLSKFSARNGLPHIHPHAFRHTAASAMIADGVDIVTAAGELGHSTPATTANIYAHQINEAKAKAEEARSAIFNNRRKKAQTC